MDVLSAQDVSLLHKDNGNSSQPLAGEVLDLDAAFSWPGRGELWLMVHRGHLEQMEAVTKGLLEDSAGDVVSQERTDALRQRFL